MGSLVNRKLESITAKSPDRLISDRDKWASFREIEIIDFSLTATIRHSLGKLSKFFLELENQRLMGTRCPNCAKVWMPPRSICPEDLIITEWVEVPGRGTIETACLITQIQDTVETTERIALGYIALDGASTSLLQQIRNFSSKDILISGLPVRAVWSDRAVEHPMELFWFEPIHSNS